MLPPLLGVDDEEAGLGVDLLGSLDAGVEDPLDDEESVDVDVLDDESPDDPVPDDDPPDEVADFPLRLSVL